MTPFRALWRTDLHRALVQARNTPWIVAGLVFLVAVVAGDGAEGAALALGGTVMLYGGALGGLAIMDRLDGTLEFLAGLPVAGRTVAAARLAVVAVMNTAAGVQIAVALALVIPGESQRLAHGATIAMLGVCAWVGLTTLSFAGIALVTRFGSTAAMNRLMIGLFAFVVGAYYLMELLVPDVEALQVRLLTTPWHIAVPAFLALCGGGAWWSVGVMARGIDRYVPTPDSITL
ncbi:hypothetical protein [Gaopeijia maritima]|uniref:Uncharacterized protein n=1 Tax=Gaopeijia maritima TaxID=3119007 RepID=A0ABU9ED51_9BACT